MPCMASLNDLCIGNATGSIVETQQNFTTICGLPVATIGDRVRVTGKDGTEEGQIVDGCDYITCDNRVVAIDGSRWETPSYQGTVRVVNRCCILCCQEIGAAGPGITTPNFSFQIGLPGAGAGFSTSNLPDLTPEQIQEISDNTGVPTSTIQDLVSNPVDPITQGSNGNSSDNCPPSNSLQSSSDGEDCNEVDDLG